ncbi:hypothetical protein CRUP_015068, partial [Coryphaenoides rupestris]
AQAEEERRLQEKEMDPLALFLVQLSDPRTLNPQETQELQQKQHWHKDIGPQKHQALKEKLIRDPRLAPHL